MQEFNGSIYTYRRSDIPNISLPAVCVYPDYIRSTAAGFRMSSLIRLQIIRNVNENNRGAIYPFVQNVTERLIQVLCYDNEFYRRNLQQDAPYVVLFGEKYSTQYEEETGTSVLDIVCDVWVPTYLEYINSYNFNPTGTQDIVTISSSPSETKTVTQAGNYVDDFYKDKV
jgi:hypothetical protein